MSEQAGGATATPEPAEQASLPDGAPAASAEGVQADVAYLNTVELMPAEDNYLYDAGSSVALRPSMMTIAQGGRPAAALLARTKVVAEVKEHRAKMAEQKRFGTCDGVIVRCLLNIWGVIMFLRMGFVVAHAGILQATLVVLVSLLLTVLTAMSLSAIATNGEVEGGGAYFLISRSLGAESGGAIGLVFAMANAVSVSMYLIGFAETVVNLYSDTALPEGNATVTEPAYMVNKAWDIRIIAMCGLVLIMVVACLGANWVVKVDIGQLVVLVIGILAFFIGSFTTPSDSAGMAFTGYSADTFNRNWGPDYRKTDTMPDGETFMSVFSVFFPAVTGMMAGANISGELKNAQKSLPFGTMFAVVLSSLVYIAIAWILGATCERDGGLGGLFADSILMIRISVWGPLVIVGIFASTISSALATLVGAPRILKAVCEDGLFPPLAYFAKGRAGDNEPIRGYGLTAVIALAGIMIGDLNAIAPLITNFFLATRALINFACFLASYSRSPGWRPSYRCYNRWVSLVTAILCVAVMFAISWYQALITLGLGVLLSVYIKRRAPPVNWGAAELGLKWLNAKKHLLQLNRVQLAHHVKTWRPIFLAVPRSSREDASTLISYAQQLSAGSGFTIYADILIGTFHEKSLQLMRRVQRRRQRIDEAAANSAAGDKSREDRDVPRKSLVEAIGIAGIDASKETKEVEMPRRNTSETITRAVTTDEIFALPGGSDTGDNDTKTEDGEAATATAATAAAPEDEDRSKSKQGKSVRFADIPESDSSNDAAPESTEEAQWSSTGQNQASSKWNEDESDDDVLGVEGKEVLVESVIASSIAEGVRIMIQMSGVGQLKPNMLLISAKSRDVRTEEDTSEIIDMVLSTLQFNYGVAILSAPSQDWGKNCIKKTQVPSIVPTCTRPTVDDDATPVIDVYWLADTGGWLLLVAYMHSQWSMWRNTCKLRVFVHARDQEALATQARMMNMLQKFRIHAEVSVFDMYAEPSAAAMAACPDVFDGPEEEVPSLKSDWCRRRTKSHLRVGEVLLKQSQDSTFVYVTLPFPNIDKIIPEGWLLWVDAITGDMLPGSAAMRAHRPPILLMRGNQRNVLTYYA